MQQGKDPVRESCSFPDLIRDTRHRRIGKEHHHRHSSRIVEYYYRIFLMIPARAKKISARASTQKLKRSLSFCISGLFPQSS